MTFSYSHFQPSARAALYGQTYGDLPPILCKGLDTESGRSLLPRRVGPRRCKESKATRSIPVSLLPSIPPSEPFSGIRYE